MMRDPDDIHGDTVVSEIVIRLRRNGSMSVSGSITDEVYARHLLDTARETLTNYHINQKLGKRSAIIVPAYDTSLVGTDAEKKLVASRDELSNAYAGAK